MKDIDLICSHLREISRIPRLSLEEEIKYGNQVRKMMSLLAAKEVLKQQLQSEPDFSQWFVHVQLPESELDRALQQGQKAKRKMVEANLCLVVSIAKKYQKRGLDLPDLIQEGSIGLTTAVEKFDPAQGYRFSTYAFHWIRQAIIKAIAQNSRVIRLPMHMYEKLSQFKNAQRQLSQKLGHTPRLDEVATCLGVDEKKMQQYVNYLH